MSNRDDQIVGTVFADQAGTLFIEQTNDKRAADPLTASSAVWDVQATYTVTASDGKGFLEDIVAPFWRIRYVNGSTNQGAFRLHARTASGGDS
jgi:hypothetical protein